MFGSNRWGDLVDSLLKTRKVPLNSEQLQTIGADQGETIIMDVGVPLVFMISNIGESWNFEVCTVSDNKFIPLCYIKDMYTDKLYNYKLEDIRPGHFTTLKFSFEIVRGGYRYSGKKTDAKVDIKIDIDRCACIIHNNEKYTIYDMVELQMDNQYARGM